MPAVNWDQPSTGLVTDANPSLLLTNDKGGALEAASHGIAIDATSKNAEALRAQTKRTLTARLHSDEFISTLATAPKATGVIGVNESAAVAVAGVNLVDPAKPLDSRDGIGVAGISARLAAYGVVGATFGPRSTGVAGTAIGGGVGVRGNGSNGGVQGVSTQGHGVAGSTQSDRSSGVFGFAPGVLGAGVSGQSLGGAGVDGRSTAGPGVRGVSTQAQGVVGESTGSNASGVFGRNDLGNGVGVDGFSQAGIAIRAVSNSGVALHAQSSSGMGLDVSTTSTSKPALRTTGFNSMAIEAVSWTDAAIRAYGPTRTGVVGGTIAGLKAGDSEVGCGVFGSSMLGAGVRGITTSGVGVLGFGSPKGGAWAGLFQGNVHVDGILFKSASLFSIDHPLDPKRRVLNHACVEAPEYKTFYDGVVTLNARGQTTVKLPRWFDALNHELRYQLTAVGAPAPDLHVAREVRQGSFAIAGGRARQKVCWQVTGVRRDAWAKANPMQVEQARSSARAAAPTVTTAELKRSAAGLMKSARAIEAEEKVRRKAQLRRVEPGRPPLPVRRPELAAEGASVASLKGLIRDVERMAAKPAAEKG